jgi:protein TonB
LLPKPAYPQIAKQAGAHGAVNIQVLVDETGRVVSAKAVSGHPLLIAAAQQAALGARFSPTRLGDQAVKVSGLITYNFVLQ